MEENESQIKNEYFPVALLEQLCNHVAPLVFTFNPRVEKSKLFGWTLILPRRK